MFKKKIQQQPVSPAMPNKVLMLQALLLIVVVAMAYMNGISAPFIFDDLESIPENTNIQKLWPISDVIFNNPPDSPPAGRPIVAISLAINYAIGGVDVWGYHVFNIIVHIAAVLVLWGVLRRTFMHTRLQSRFEKTGPLLPFAVALIWAVHPLHTETVTYISQRTELLMGLFYLLTLYCALRSWQSQYSRLWLVLAVVSCAIGMGCKETMVSAPLMVLLVDVLLVSSSWRDALRKHWKLYVGLAATWGLLAAINLSLPRGRTCGWDVGMHPLDYLRTQADIIVWYLRLCFWPDPLVISYQGWPIAQSFIDVWWQGLFIVALFGLTVYALWRRHPAALLGAWFFMILAPTSSLIPIVTEIAAERRMYLPLAAVIIAMVVGLDAIIRWVNQRRATPLGGTAGLARILLVLITIALGITTHMRNRDYKTGISIWTDAVNKRPDNPQALCNFGFVLAFDGQYEHAVSILNKAIELKPDYDRIYVSRGTAYAAIEQFAPAIEDFNWAIELNPYSAEAHYKRANAYAKTGDIQKAIADFTKSIELKHDYADSFYNRGLAYGRMRDFARAADDFTRTIELKSDHAEAYYNRGISFGRMRDYKRAVQDYTRAIELKPDHASAYTNRGNAYANLGDANRAIADHSSAIEIDSAYARAYYNRATAYYSTGEHDRAWADIKKCQELGHRVNPAFIQALQQVSSRPVE